MLHPSKIRIVGLFIVPAMLWATTTQVWAQADSDPAQVVGLFVQTCVKFAGYPRGLQQWVAAHHLPQLSGNQAAVFLGMAPGEAFAANTKSGEHVLDLFSNGLCGVIAKSDKEEDVYNMLLSSFTKHHLSVKQVDANSHLNVSSITHRLNLSSKTRSWTIYILEKPHQDDPNLAPELDLFAVPR